MLAFYLARSQYSQFPGLSWIWLKIKSNDGKQKSFFFCVGFSSLHMNSCCENKAKKCHIECRRQTLSQRLLIKWHIISLGYFVPRTGKYVKWNNLLAHQVTEYTGLILFMLKEQTVGAQSPVSPALKRKKQNDRLCVTFSSKINSQQRRSAQEACGSLNGHMLSTWAVSLTEP